MVELTAHITAVLTPHDTLRRGLVAFVGADQAQILAACCLEPSRT